MKCIPSRISNRPNLLIFLHRQIFVILKMQSIRILSGGRLWLLIELHGIRVMDLDGVGLVDHLINKQSLFMSSVIKRLNWSLFLLKDYRFTLC